MIQSHNISLAKATVNWLAELGVKEIVLCSGNRNAPLIAVSTLQDSIQVLRHFNESAAAFFALGRIKSHGSPVAVLVTSGTAATELASATCEAFYSRLPLVLVTADRPKRYRGSGAPQSIDQRDLFSANVAASFDIDSPAELPSTTTAHTRLWNQGPIQLNVCFEEPLIDGELTLWVPNAPVAPEEHGPRPSECKALESFLMNTQKPLVILGRIPASSHQRVEDFLLSLKSPVYAEGLSGLRESWLLSPYVLKSGDALLRKLDFDAVLRIGSVPTLGFWRDLERNPKFQDVPVLSLSSEVFSGLARESQVLPLLESRLSAPKPASYAQAIELDGKFFPKLVDLFEEFPLSEPSFYRTASERIEQDAFVYLGNSLPIRLWDLCASFDTNHRTLEANRGVNGIDGQLSTFFGACRLECTNWCFVGDLTALYDLSAPYILDQLSSKLSFRLVIVNNGGGRIFELLPDYSSHFEGTAAGDAFIQPQRVDLEGFATLWGLPFERHQTMPEMASLPARCIIEIVPEQAQTRAFWKKYREILASVD